MSAAPPGGRVRWGILATGGVAGLMTKDLLAHGHQVSAVASRSQERAEQFAREFGVDRAHGSYDDLVTDPAVDVVYVATPHHLHADHAVAALVHGKHVLVEKPFTHNAADARRIADTARAEGLLAMEAMWTRFLPHMAFVRRTLASGRIGVARSLHATHAQRLSADPAHRLNDLRLAGGATLDLGCYPISFAHDLLGPPTEVVARGTLKDTGVDGSVATTALHHDAALSTSYSSTETPGPNTACVLGTDGRIEISSVWYAPAVVTVHDASGEVADRFDEPVSGRGMQLQAAEVERLLVDGLTESPLMPVADSIAVVETMDRVRGQVGVRYPGE